jgi:hypothetical protein
MNVEIGTDAVQFPEKEHMNGYFGCSVVKNSVGGARRGDEPRAFQRGRSALREPAGVPHQESARVFTKFCRVFLFKGTV